MRLRPVWAYNSKTLPQNKRNEISDRAGHWWSIPVILATQEAEIGRKWFNVSPGK
jgi:hypothetical protein